MRFIIQNDANVLEIEEKIITDLLNRNKLAHEYDKILLKDIDRATFSKGTIPVGTIEFVTRVLNKTYGFEKEHPIEIPKYLRTDEFLKRNYEIIKGTDLPRRGSFFIKNASTLKDFSYCGRLENLEEILEQSKNNDYFVLSSIFDIESEYRVYVFDNKIVNICNYNGDVTLLPDISLLNKVINLISMNEKYLKSYTIDVMVNRKYGTAIIEIHNFTSCGLYSTLWGNDLLYAYRDGIDYLLNDNKEIST